MAGFLGNITNVHTLVSTGTGTFTGLIVSGSFTGTITQSNTAARAYTLPDKDGTFAMMSDIVAGGGVTLDTTQTITGLKSFQQGDNASLGAECITAVADRDFSAAGAWTGTGWSIVSGALAHTAGANAATLPNTSLNITPTNGVVYVIAMKIITTTLGTVTLSFGGASLGIVAGQWVGTVYVNKYVLATGSTALTVTPDATWVGSIDDISIKILTRSSYPSMRLFTTAGGTAAEIRNYNNTNFGLGNAVHRSNVSGTHNYGLGYYTQAGLTTGIANIGIGTEVQEFLTNGTHNIGIGYYVQNSITSSSYNIGIGGYTQQNLTTGFNNIGIGFEVQRYLTVGWNNVGIGTSAQRVLTTGRGNVGLGYQSQMALTTGDYNMGIGANCLRNLISGSSNTAIGNNCLYTITTQANNTGIGTDTLFNCASTNNTGVGYGVLGDLTSGGYNTAYGALAGDGATNATISYCSFFGYGANSSLDGITNSTAIGNGATVTASNQIRLGNSNVTQVVTSGNLIAYAAIIGTQFQSNIPDGTAPITVVSKTLVTNLNADYLNGQHGSYYAPTDQTMYIGTTAVAINRASGALNLTLGGTLSATTGTFSGAVTVASLNGYTIGTSSSNGQPWPHIPVVKADGVMEIGKYIDFHDTSNDGTDLALRLYSNTGWLMTPPIECSGNINMPKANNWSYLMNSASQGGLKLQTSGIDCLSVSSFGNFVQAHLPFQGTSGSFTTLNTTSHNTWSKAQTVDQLSLNVVASTLNIDASTSNNQRFVLTVGSITLANPTNLVAGKTLNLVFVQDSTGNRAISSWGTMWKFAGGTKPTLSTAPNAIDIMSCYYDGSNLLCALMKGMA